MNPPLSPTILGEIISFGLWMRKEGYRESTIRPCIRALKGIARRSNLLDPESVKSYLASAELSENRKEKLTHDLSRFYRWKHIPYQKPTYERVEKLPFIPLESEVDQLISGVGSKTATFLQLLKETGMRPGEAWDLRWTDIDHERRTVNIAPEKNSRPRQSRISDRLIAMISDLLHTRFRRYQLRITPNRTSSMTLTRHVFLCGAQSRNNDYDHESRRTLRHIIVAEIMIRHSSISVAHHAWMAKYHPWGHWIL